MPDVKEIIKQIQLITYGAYGASGQVAALLGKHCPRMWAETNTRRDSAECAVPPLIKRRE